MPELPTKRVTNSLYIKLPQEGLDVVRVAIRGAFYDEAPAEDRSMALRCVGAEGTLIAINHRRWTDGTDEIRYTVYMDDPIDEIEGYQNDGRLMEDLDANFIQIVGAG